MPLFYQTFLFFCRVQRFLNLKYWYYFFSFKGFKSVITGSAQPQITASNLTSIRYKKSFNLLKKYKQIRNLQ